MSNNGLTLSFFPSRWTQTQDRDLVYFPCLLHVNLFTLFFFSFPITFRYTLLGLSENVTLVWASGVFSAVCTSRAGHYNRFTSSYILHILRPIRPPPRPINLTIWRHTHSHVLFQGRLNNTTSWLKPGTTRCSRHLCRIEGSYKWWQFGWLRSKCILGSWWLNEVAFDGIHPCLIHRSLSGFKWQSLLRYLVWIEDSWPLWAQTSFIST